MRLGRRIRFRNKELSAGFADKESLLRGAIIKYVT